MTLKISLAFLLTILISCSQKSTRDENIYIVPKRQKPQVATRSNEPPPPPPIQTYYLPSNFIIDTAGQIYFYQQQFGWMICGTGIDWDTPPAFIDLKPKDLVQVPITSIEDFIKLNIVTLDSHDRRVAIASIKDTATSVGLTKIFKVFNDTTNKINWTFRKATQEEAIVLAYKQHNREYYSNDIKWDSSKIRSAPNSESDIKFTTPKVEDE